MPASSSKSPGDLLNFDFFNDFETSDQVGKVKSKEKKSRKKHEIILAEQSDQEKATKFLDDDGVCPQEQETISHMADSKSPDLPKIPSASKGISRPTSNTYPSPAFAALGAAFRDNSFDKRREIVEQAVESDSLSTSPQNRGISTSIPQSSIPSRIQPVSSPNPAEVIRGGFSHNSPPTTSPRLAHRQMSRRPSGYQYQADSLATSPRGRPVSMPSHMYHLPSPSGFNLNQMRGITNDMVGDVSRSTSRKATKYNFMALDTLVSAGDVTTSSSDNVLLAAYENSLQVFHLAHDKAVRIGKLEGLRGYVVSAKILPSPNRHDPLRTIRPLVALIVHGPEITGEELSRPSSRHSDQSFDPSYPHDARAMPGIAKYQTSVEIYSLKQHSHVATLFATAPEEPKIDNVFGKKSYEPPGPIGSLSVHVTDRYVAVTSTDSGEIYMYDFNSGRAEQRFRCIGKTWTSIPSRRGRTWSTSSTPEEELSRERSPLRQRYEAPLMALQGRLLVYLPPIASSGSTVFGRVRLPENGRDVPGLKSHTATSQPQATCKVETPLDGSKVNELARGVTQEMLKGAKWVGDQGMQAWKNYWSPKSPEHNAQLDGTHQNQQFPPTHASDDSTRAAQQPTIVSFLDLDKLADAHNQRPESALQPIASFVLPGGCSFMALNPAGLALLTASAKGDVQNVWDLMQLVYPKLPATGLPAIGAETSGIIRQIARFTRITTACIVDVAWLGPRGTKVAILTDRGTIHLHDLPTIAFEWPPRDTKRHGGADIRHSDPASQVTTPSGWGSAFGAVSSGAQTISAAVRSNPLAQFSNISLAQVGAGASVKGGKIVAAGFSRSVEAASGTVSTLMSMGETRLHVPGASKSVKPGSARWWYHRDYEAIAVVGDGIVRVQKVVVKKDVNHGKRRYSVVGSRVAELAVPEPQERRESDWEMVNDGYDVTGEWSGEPLSQKHRRPRSMTNPLSSAEIETNSPYQPLYTDRRIEFETFTDDSYIAKGMWAFGQDIRSEPLDTVTVQPEVEPDLPVLPDDTFVGLVEQIEEALPIADSPPKIKSKKNKKGKGKISNAMAPEMPSEDPMWNPDLEPDEDINDLMRL